MCKSSQKIITQPKSLTFNRKKIWELDSHLHCSVIGTCLSLKELRKLCSRGGIVLNTRITDHELHTSFVSEVNEKTHLTQLLQKHLESKYRKIIQKFTRIDSSEAVIKLWREAVSQGDVAGAYWAITTSPLVSESLLSEIFGEVHMLSHLSGAAIRMDMQKFKRLRRQVPVLEADLAKAKTESHKRQLEQEKILRGLNRQLGTMRAETESLRQIEQQFYEFKKGIKQSRLQKKLKETETQFAKLQKRLESSGQEIDEWQEKALSEQKKNTVMGEQLIELTAERDALENMVELILEPECAGCAHNEHCSNNADLRGRCIMFVGGRHKQSAYFKALVERQNGRFLHHDGGLENSRVQLGKTLSRADIIVCPINCISHSAINTVKRHCKKTTKQLVLLRHSSLSAFTKGLAGIAYS